MPLLLTWPPTHPTGSQVLWIPFHLSLSFKGTWVGSGGRVSSVLILLRHPAQYGHVSGIQALLGCCLLGCEHSTKLLTSTEYDQHRYNDHRVQPTTVRRPLALSLCVRVDIECYCHEQDFFFFNLMMLANASFSVHDSFLGSLLRSRHCKHNILWEIFIDTVLLYTVVESAIHVAFYFRDIIIKLQCSKYFKTLLFYKFTCFCY